MSKITVIVSLVSAAVLGVYMVAGGGEFVETPTYFENKKPVNTGISNEERRKNEMFMRILKSSAGIKED